MAGRAGLSFLQVAILARLLGPADFGLMALVAAVISFAQIFTDVGVSSAIIHHQRVSHEELSSLYWLNVAVGAGMLLLLIIFSPLIAGVYDAPALQPLLTVVGFFFLVISLGQQLRVVAEKELRFAELARVELTASTVGFLVAVAWALIRPSVAALIAGMMASAVTLTALSWGTLAKGWRPMARLRLSEIRKFLNYGGYTMANNLVSTLSAQADIFIGGRFLSAPALGVYSLPRDLSLRVAGVINPIVTRVGLPVMAKAQHNQVFLRSVYLKTLRMTSSVNFPIYMAIAAFAPEVVALLFGRQWDEAVGLLRVLALWALFRSVVNPVGSLIFAVGRADLGFKWNLALGLVVLPLLWLGGRYGNFGLAIAQLFISIIVVGPAWYILVRPLCAAGFAEYFKQLLIPLITASLAVVAGYGAASWLTHLFARLSTGLVIGGLSYFFLSKWLNRPWFEAMGELLLKRQHVSKI